MATTTLRTFPIILTMKTRQDGLMPNEIYTNHPTRKMRGLYLMKLHKINASYRLTLTLARKKRWRRLGPSGYKWIMVFKRTFCQGSIPSRDIWPQEFYFSGNWLSLEQEKQNYLMTRIANGTCLHIRMYILYRRIRWDWKDRWNKYER